MARTQCQVRQISQTYYHFATNRTLIGLTLCVNQLYNLSWEIGHLNSRPSSARR